MSEILHSSVLSAERSYRYEGGSELAGIIYLHRISDARFSGAAGHNLKMFRKLCGDSTLRNVILATNMWEEVTLTVGEARERELAQEFLKPILDKGAKFVRHHNTAESAHGIIRCIMKNQPTALQIQRELIDERKDITDTSAGQVLKKELDEQIRRHQANVKAIREEMFQALKQNDEEIRRGLQEEMHKIYENVNRIRMVLEGMVAEYNEEKWRMGEAVRRIQEETRRGREQAEAEYLRRMDDLNRHLQESTNLAALLSGRHHSRSNPQQTGGAA